MKLQIHTSASADQVEEYLRAKCSLEAYYSTDEQEIVGDWGGLGAEMLGLKGPVTDEPFGRLLHNLHPHTGEQLTDRMRKDRRPGFDMVWNVPKSVSLVYAYTKDERIIQALREVVGEMRDLAQEQAAVRVRAGDKNRDEDRVTKWLISAEHIHLTARPEDGYSDPHMHVHLYIPNISWDPVEKKFKALQMGRIHEMAADLEKLATKRMAEKLEAIGLKIIPTEHAYEIEGFYRELVEKFSRRTATIEATAERLGITDPAKKAKLAALTRENKIKDVKFSDFEPIWWGSLLPEEEQPFKAAQERLTLSRTLGIERLAPPSHNTPEINLEPAAMKFSLGRKSAAWAKDRFKLLPDGRRYSVNRATRPQRQTREAVKPNEDDRRAVALALEHLLERKSVVTEFQIVAEASTNWCLNKTTVAGLWQAVAETPLYRREKDGWVFVTTPEVWAEERRIVDECLFRQEQFEPINKHWQVRDEELNAGQQAGVQHILQSRDFIVGLKGDPGVGKTRVLQELRRGVESRMCKMLVVAPGAGTTHNVLRKDGFENAETVAKLMFDRKLQEEYRGGVWVVDEAGQLSTRDADELIALAHQFNARLVLVGDSAQHPPVQRGRAFELLENEGGMKTARITEIQRQKGDYLKSVQLVLDKQPGKAIDLMAQMGNIVEAPLQERMAALAKDYVDALEAGETAGIIAPTHVERRVVTEAVRVELKKRGLLKEAYQKRITQKLEWSEMQKSNPAQYRIGQIIEITAPVKGYRMNEQFDVVAVRDDMVRVRSRNPHHTNTKPLPLHAPEAFDVYEHAIEQVSHREVLQKLSWTEAERSDPAHYSIGLTVQINAHVKGFALGEQLDVVRVSNDTVKVQNAAGKNKVLPLDYPDAFTIYEKETIEVCEGERIHITGNGRTADGHRLINGVDYTVDHISHDGMIVLDNGYRLDERFKHFEHGYTDTSHGAQGRTYDRIFIAQSEMSRGASDMKQFLVSLSRGRKGAKVYTHSVEDLREYVSRERESLMATELFRTEPEITTTASDERTSAELGTHGKQSPEIEGEIASDEISPMSEYSSAALGEIDLWNLPEPRVDCEPEINIPMNEELEIEL